MRFDKVAILGTGLLGGSVGLALRRRKLAREVWGYDLSQAARNEARRRGAVDEASGDFSDACRGASLVVVALPVGAFEQAFGRLAKAAPSDCLVTDVGSVKGGLALRCQALCKPLAYVPAHPMAGSEKAGIGAARQDLFDGSPCFVTPGKVTPEDAVAEVTRFWRALGCWVGRVDPKRHDRIVAALSHLPHAAAFALMAASAKGILSRDEWVYAGNGFKDTTRVAASSAQVWADIFLANRAEMESMLAVYTGELNRLKAFLRKGDAAGLRLYLQKASDKKKSVG